MVANTPIDAEPITVTFEARPLGKALKACLAVTPKDAIRPSLEGVSVRLHDGLVTFESTDGYRMVLYTLNPTHDLKDVAGHYWLRPEEIKAMLSIWPKGGTYELLLAPIEHPYPDLERLVPKTETAVQLNPKYAADALASLKGAETIQVEPHGPNSAFVFRAGLDSHPRDSVVHVVMPMHTNG